MAYKVTITYNGTDYVYPGGNLPYFFVLPQTDGRIIFHLGVLGNLPADQDPKQPFNMTAYKAVVDDGVTTKTYDVPAHWWNGRWTHYPSPISIVRTPAQLVAARRMFPYGDTGCKLPSQSVTPKCTLMGSSDITIYMPTTGERPDIGLSTDNSAWYMLGKDPDGMIQWGLAGTSCPMHFRDQGTGKPIDLLKYPSTNSYSLPGYQGSPWLAQGKQAANGYCEYGGGWQPQQAHYCEMSYVAYLATQNPSFLEDLQYSANFTVFCSKEVSGPAVPAGEYRGAAWAFRNLFMAHAATLDAEASGSLPNGCLPSSYWKTILDNTLAHYSKYMGDPNNQVFRLVTGYQRFAPWQCDYMLTALAFGVLTGHSDWSPLYLWALENVIARTRNTPWQNGGFPPGWGTPYYMDVAPTWYDAFLGLKDKPEGGVSQAQIDALKIDPLNGGKAMQGNEYLMTTRAALIMADYLDKQGICNVRGTYPELDKCIKICTDMNTSYGSMNPRVSVIFTGGIIMPTAVTINLGQKVHLDVAFTGPKPPAPPTYTQTDATVGSLSAGDMAGVLFTSIKVGKSIVTAATTGVNGPLSASCEVTVNSPLPTGITLTPGAVS